jgi:HPt (histidine-containing phosphotransfer) domain-containing protein
MTGATPDSKAAVLGGRMAELAVKFLNRTGEDIARMKVLSARLASGDVGAPGEIRHLAHRMVGTGATLGFESIAERAHRLETLAESCSPGVGPEESLRAQINEALVALETEFHRHDVDQ